MCPVPQEEKHIQRMLEEIEQAIADGNHAYAEELNYELDEYCNMMEGL